MAVPLGVDPPTGGDAGAGRRRAGGGPLRAGPRHGRAPQGPPHRWWRRSTWPRPSDHDLALVVAGPDGWGVEAFDAAVGAARHRDRIRRLGWVDDQARADLLAGARCLAFPSVYEGFGLPPLEAMAAGVPVVCSTWRSLRRGAGGRRRASWPPATRRRWPTRSRRWRTDEAARPTWPGAGSAGGPLQLGRVRRAHGRPAAGRRSAGRPLVAGTSAADAAPGERHGAAACDRGPGARAPGGVGVKALVTGAAGFVGRHLVAHLERCGDDVVGADAGERARPARRRALARLPAGRSAPTSCTTSPGSDVGGGVLGRPGRHVPGQRRGHAAPAGGLPGGRRRAGARRVQLRRVRAGRRPSELPLDRGAAAAPGHALRRVEGGRRPGRPAGPPGLRPRHDPGPGLQPPRARPGQPLRGARPRRPDRRGRGRGPQLHPGRQPDRPARLHRRARRRPGLPAADRTRRARRGLQRLLPAATSPIAELAELLLRHGRRPAASCGPTRRC